MIKLRYFENNSLVIKELEVNKFPAGELRINIEYVPDNTQVDIEMKFQGSDDIMALLLLENALSYKGCEVDTLIIPYFPYGRQDRVCNPGESYSLWVLQQLINDLGCNVIVMDPHSNTQVEGLNSCVAVEQHEIWREVIRSLGRDIIIVVPDKGATEKSQKISDVLDLPLIYCTKDRDTLTGKILGFTVKGAVAEGTYVIVDDICDGGGTFVGLAQELKDLGATKIILCTTHGIFSKGIDVLLESGIDEIYTTDSMVQVQAFKDPRFKVINLDYLE